MTLSTRSSKSGSSFGTVLRQYSYQDDTSSSLGQRATRKSTLEDRNQSSGSISSPKLLQPSTPAISQIVYSPTSGSRKRKASGLVATPSPSPLKKKRSSSGYAPPSKYSHLTNLLTDSLAPNLICVFIGVNPGIRTATTGHAYSHPSNLFWKLCYSSGCTPRLCKPEEDQDLPHLYALGHTNIVSRPTKDASELSAKEMDEGVGILEEKVRTWRPESVCIVGKGIWESIWRVKHGQKITKSGFKYGWQDDSENMGMVTAGDTEEQWQGARVFVATTTSGLAAGMKPHEKEEVWRGLGKFVAHRRKERNIPDEGGVKTELDMVKEEPVEQA